MYLGKEGGSFQPALLATLGNWLFFCCRTLQRFVVACVQDYTGCQDRKLSLSRSASIVVWSYRLTRRNFAKRSVRQDLQIIFLFVSMSRREDIDAKTDLSFLIVVSRPRKRTEIFWFSRQAKKMHFLSLPLHPVRALVRERVGACERSRLDILPSFSLFPKFTYVSTGEFLLDGC